MSASSTYARTMSRLGIVALCPPLLSLCQGRLGLELVPTLADFLAYYRGIADAILDVLYVPARWAFGDDPSRLVRDLHVLSFLGMALYHHSERVLNEFRARGGRFADDDPEAEPRKPLRLDQVAVTTYVGGLLFLGLPWVGICCLFLMPVYAVMKIRSRLAGMRGALPFPETETMARGDLLARQGWILAAAVLVFFAISWIERAAGS
jgi:hypothetical protein